MQYITNILASAYGSGSYDSSTYNGSAGTTTTTGSGTTTATGGAAVTKGGVLTDTGFDLVLAATLACVIIFMALLVRFWKRPVTQAQAAEESQNGGHEADLQ